MFFANSDEAFVCAVDQLTPRNAAPASADASAEFCVARLPCAQNPTSIASAHIPSRTTRKTTNNGNV